MRRQQLTALLAVGAFGIGACAGGGSSGSERRAGQGVAVGEPIDSSAPAPDAAMGDELVPTVVTPTPGTVDVAPIGWEGAQPVDDQQAAVLITWWSGVEPCSVLDHYTVRESDDRVEVTLFQGSQPSEDGEQPTCPEIGRYTGVVVELDAPLDGRMVVDGTE